MGERKVLIKYFPPDFDPSKVPKGKRAKVMNIRMMLPFSVQCTTCAEFMYAGKKFNSRCEIVENETYLGLRKYRFYIKCCVCCAEISFKTDPQNADYELEAGATRNFEAWKAAKQAEQQNEAARAEEDLDTIKALENRALDSKLELDVLDALDEIKAINQRHERVDPLHELILKESQLQPGEEKLSADEAAALAEIKAIWSQRLNTRLSDSEKEDDELRPVMMKSNEKMQIHPGDENSKSTSSSLPVVLVKKKKRKKQTSNSSVSAKKSKSSKTAKDSVGAEQTITQSKTSHESNSSPKKTSLVAYGSSESEDSTL